MPRFPGSRLSTMSIRGVLRACLEQDERVVGWSTIQSPRSALDLMAAMLAGIVPPVALVLAPMAALRRRGVLVLTDRRVLLIRDVPASGVDRLVAADIPLEVLDVRAGLAPGDGTEPLARVFEIDLPGRADTEFELVMRTKPAERLRRGLTLLARADNEPARYADRPGASPGDGGKESLSAWPG